MTEREIEFAMEDAITSNDINKIKELIEKDSSILNMMTLDGTWLHVAAYEGNLEAVKYFIEKGIDVNREGGTYEAGAIIEAIDQGQKEIVTYLLDHGVRMDVSDSVKNPLIASIVNRNAEIAKLLIERGIDTSHVYTRDSGEKSDAYKYALEWGEMEIAEMIKDSLDKNNVQRNEKEFNFDSLNELGHYIEDNFGPIDKSLSEILPGSTVEITVNVILPSFQKDYLTLVTSGVSDLPMGNTEYVYAELVMYLPKDWKLDNESLNDEKFYWPVGWIRKIGHFPHMSTVSFQHGMILQNEEPSVPFNKTVDFCCFLVYKDELNQQFFNKENKEVQFFLLLPIFKEEWELAVEKGYPILIDKLKEICLDKLFDTNRKNVGAE